MANFSDVQMGLRWLRVRYRPKLLLTVPGAFGRKGRLNAPQIAEAVRAAVIKEAKRARWLAPPRAKLSLSLIFWGDGRSAPAIHNLVKFYVDLLQGVAFVDDRQISHLTAGFCRGTLCSSGPNGAIESEVSISIERLVDFNRRFDLCFASGFEADTKREPDSSEVEYSPLDKSLLSTFPEETRRLIRKLELANVQKRLLSHSKLGSYDRPGVHLYMRDLVPTYEELRKFHPLVIDLGNLPQRRGTPLRINREL